MKFNQDCYVTVWSTISKRAQPLPTPDYSLLGESEQYWSYRSEWPRVNERYQGLLALLPDRFRVSPVYLGAEIEMENVNIHSHLRDQDTTPPGLFSHTDGSLRNGMEFVTKPLSFEQLILSLASLERWMELSLQKPPSFSWRTSNHVHLNVRDMTYEELTKLILLYSIFELQMFKYAGDTRLNSVFCVPLTKTRLHENVSGVIHKGHAASYFGRETGWDKYCALGLYRLFDLGTVEFRHMPGGFNLNQLSTWISFILSLRVAASSIPSNQLEYFIKNLNTLCNYRELQVLVFGNDLANKLGSPESCVQMLSNGVTFAKKCLTNPANPEQSKESAMALFLGDLLNQQDVLYQKAIANGKPVPTKSKSNIHEHLLNIAAAQGLVAAEIWPDPQPVEVPPTAPQFGVGAGGNNAWYTSTTIATEDNG